MAFRKETFTLPAHWASYLINNDASGISAEEKANADSFLQESKLPFPVSCGEQSWFSRSHDASHITKCAGDVLDYTFLLPVLPCPYPMNYFDKAFQQKANLWWRELSLNEMAAFRAKYGIIISNPTLKSDIAAMYDAETKQQKTN